MKRVFVLLSILLSVIMFSCATKKTGSELSTPPANPNKEPMALIIRGVEGGNSIVGSNMSTLKDVKVYKQINEAYILCNNNDTPIFLKDGLFGFVDKGYSGFAKYKIIAIDNSGKEYELPTIEKVSRE